MFLYLVCFSICPQCVLKSQKKVDFQRKIIARCWTRKIELLNFDIHKQVASSFLPLCSGGLPKVIFTGNLLHFLQPSSVNKLLPVARNWWWLRTLVGLIKKNNSKSLAFIARLLYSSISFNWKAARKWKAWSFMKFITKTFSALRNASSTFSDSDVERSMVLLCCSGNPPRNL